jgi:AcrR family transcriptional regulator
MLAKSEKQNHEARQKSRKKICSAALELFARDGYRSTSMDKVAQKAGVSKGLLYNYFSSKEQLLSASVFEEMDQLMAEMFTPLLSLPCKQQLRAMIELSLTPEKWPIQMEYFSYLSTLMFSPDVPAGFKEQLVQMGQGMVTQIAHLLEQCGYKEPQINGYLLGAQIDGIQMHYMMLGSDYPIKTMRERILKDWNLEKE